jgi:beta-glucosidase
MQHTREIRLILPILTWPHLPPRKISYHQTRRLQHLTRQIALPNSVPLDTRHTQDNPAYLNSKCEKGRMIYGEDVYIGYRYYEQISLPVLFPFGHGLSYTTFSQSDLRVAADDQRVTVSLKLHNTGAVDGTEVVQVYVSQHCPSTTRPRKELRGFEKVFVKAGDEKDVEVVMSVKYATSFWDESRSVWASERDIYKVLVGNSSQGEFLEGEFMTAMDMAWTGL